MGVGSVEGQKIPQKSGPDRCRPGRGHRRAGGRHAVYPAQTILTSLFGDTAERSPGSAIPEGKLAASFAFDDTARVAGFVSANNEVAVFLTSRGQPRRPGGDPAAASTG